MLHSTLVHVLAESTQPRRHVGQGLHRLVSGRQSGRKRKFHISRHARNVLFFRPVIVGGKNCPRKDKNEGKETLFCLVPFKSQDYGPRIYALL